MIVKSVERNKEDGTVSVQWLLENEQMMFLCNFALEFLIAKGLISVTKVSEEELKAMELQLEKEVQESFLASFPADEMGNA